MVADGVAGDRDVEGHDVADRGVVGRGEMGRDAVDPEPDASRKRSGRLDRHEVAVAGRGVGVLGVNRHQLCSHEIEAENPIVSALWDAVLAQMGPDQACDHDCHFRIGGLEEVLRMIVQRDNVDAVSGFLVDVLDRDKLRFAAAADSQGTAFQAEQWEAHLRHCS